MYETGGDLCPVKSYQLYLMKLHPLQPRLFQQPRRKATPDSPMWYGKAPIGEKALQQMMANISGIYPWLIITITQITKHIFLWIRLYILSLVGLTGNDHQDCYPMRTMVTIMNVRLSAIINVHQHLKNIVVKQILIGSLRGVHIIDSIWLAVLNGFLVGSRSWGRAINVLHGVLHQYIPMSYLASRDNSLTPS